MIETLIIGTGITGAFTAYLLALAGIQPVIVGDNAGHPPASFVNPGGLNPLHGPGVPGPLSAFSLEAYRCHLQHWENVQRLSGIDFKPRLVQRLLPAWQSDDEARLLKVAEHYQQTPGFSAAWLSAKQLHALEPRLTSQIRGGVLTRGNATVDSGRYVQALLKAAQCKGVQYLEGKVVTIEKRSACLKVHLAQGDVLSAKTVVLATGCWSQLWPDFTRPPLLPIKGDLVRVQLNGDPLPFDITHGKDGVYHLQDQAYWLGGSQLQTGFDASPSPTQAQDIAARIAEWLPGASSQWQVLGHEAALRPGTPDGFPLLGPLKDPRLIGCSGAGPKGMLWSAGLAAGVLSLLQKKPMPLAQHFNPLRFETKENHGTI